MRGRMMSTLVSHWLALLLLMLAGCLGGCSGDPQGSTRDFWDRQENIVKPGGP